MTLQLAGFLDHSTVNGEGFRTTVFLSGCHHHCPECHNPDTQKFDYGTSISVDTLMGKILKNAPLIDGVTLSGGDPFEQAEALYPLLVELKAHKLSVWVYTGYTYEALLANPRFAKLLPLIDVLVDGPYIASLHTDTMKYIGSSNQRILQLEDGHVQQHLIF